MPSAFIKVNIFYNLNKNRGTVYTYSIIPSPSQGNENEIRPKIYFMEKISFYLGERNLTSFKI